MLKTLGELIDSGYKYKTIKEELKDNLIKFLSKNETAFNGIIGYENSVIPEIERAILSGHNINLLGLRGQAKTRIARGMINLLDEYIPYVNGSEINDDPQNPISTYAKNLILELKNDTPISWLHRNDRYSEKLATPDVSVADLIGDIDPIKAANLKLSISNEKVIHYGIIPRSNRSIFVINELPDLQARIQVALLNILQEGDVQIRGFKLRLPLDIQFIFTANPEDYTNRGSIITPLKDRIGSQILTHYPKNLVQAIEITNQEVKSINSVFVPEIAKELIEQISFEARKSEYVDQKSGVSARLSISAYQNLLSTAQRRMIMNNEKSTTVRISDFQGVIPAITGKVEMVYEGEQEGAVAVAYNLVSKAIKTTFTLLYPSPEKKNKNKESVYTEIIKWFNLGNVIDIGYDISNKEYKKNLLNIDSLKAFVDKMITEDKEVNVSEEEKLFIMEFVLWGLSEYSMISCAKLESGVILSDMLSSLLSSDE
ncbi:MAG: magnesium chelatase [Chlorobiota bacterium]|jgi:magnesium chelatase subunit I|nr:magnesium chelatase [Chlorobiota bacterium]QQS67195.1 MAG: magnesium chelatase [Chlorobiota bacterium]